MLQPKNTKFKKVQNKKIKKKFSYQSCLTMNYKSRRSIFVFSKESGVITSIQLEIGKKLIQKILNKVGSVFLSSFPQVPVSKKPIGVRIGKGKGSVSFWVSKVNYGQKLFEIKSTEKNYSIITQVVKGLSKKFPIKLALRNKHSTKVWLN